VDTFIDYIHDYSLYPLYSLRMLHYSRSLESKSAESDVDCCLEARH
jgi:hypothetical protein